jgi:DNA sulfur modification protein DndD
MWLSRIELKNFKSYRQQVFEFPQPHAGKNLVLIGGINGYGKTTGNPPKFSNRQK